MFTLYLLLMYLTRQKKKTMLHVRTLPLLLCSHYRLHYYRLLGGKKLSLINNKFDSGFKKIKTLQSNIT